MSKQKPAHEIRLGRIRGTVWKNGNDNGVFYNVTFSRLYKDDNNQWQDASSYGRDDLPLLAKVADLVHTWIYQEGTNDRKEGSTQD